jgi:4-hydroxybenzoyl-CoA reductase subunit beta
MLRLPRFRYLSPASLAEAVRMKSDAGPDSSFVAGGTDLYPNMKRRQQTPGVVIGLSRIEGLRTIRFEAGGTWLGAGAILSDLENDPRLRRAWPGLAHAIAEISTPPLRNMGTIGGNLLLDTRCNYYDQNLEWRQAIDYCMKKDGEICWVAPGSPRCLAVQSADSVPVLIALEARVRLVSAAGEREIPLEELYVNDGIHYLTKSPDELLTEVFVPATAGRSVYKKLRRRGSFDFPVLSVGVHVGFEGGRVRGARLVLGGVASAPVRLGASEKALIGRPLDEGSILEAAQAAAGPSRPMDNTDFSFLWRKEMTRKYVERALREIISAPAV